MADSQANQQEAVARLLQGLVMQLEQSSTTATQPAVSQHEHLSHTGSGVLAGNGAAPNSTTGTHADNPTSHVRSQQPPR